MPGRNAEKHCKAQSQARPAPVAAGRVRRPNSQSFPVALPTVFAPATSGSTSLTWNRSSASHPACSRSPTTVASSSAPHSTAPPRRSRCDSYPPTCSINRSGSSCSARACKPRSDCGVPMLSTETNACRLVFSEADALPGVIVDKYGDLVILQLLAKALDNAETRSADRHRAQRRTVAAKHHRAHRPAHPRTRAAQRSLHDPALCGKRRSTRSSARISNSTD